jgi:hypothetical protein
MHTCPACGNATMAGPQAGTIGQLVMNGPGNVLVSDGAGNMAGQMGGTTVNMFPGSSVIGVTSGVDPTKDPQKPILSIPTGTDLTVTLDGTSLMSDSLSDLSFDLPGYTLGVIGADLQPGHKDTLTISKLADEVSFSTDTMETPTLEIGIATTGADWQFLIKATGDMNGQKVDLKIDLAKQQLRVECSNLAGTTAYDIEVHKIDDSGDQMFKHTGNTEGAADAIYLDYGAWAGNGAAMQEEIDTGNNGSIDGTMMLSDMP